MTMATVRKSEVTTDTFLTETRNALAKKAYVVVVVVIQYLCMSRRICSVEEVS